MPNMPFSRYHSNREKGIVLTMVLYIIVVFVIIGLVLVTLMTIISQSSYQLLYTTQAYYISESGLEYGLYQIKDDSFWNDGTPASNLATGVGFNPPDQSNTIFSVGFSSSGIQNGTLTSVGSVQATQVFSIDQAPAQRVVTMSVPRIY
jgi:Tfp pilus assembly protein PilX